MKKIRGEKKKKKKKKHARRAWLRIEGG